MGAQALVWFVVGGGAAVLAISLLHTRYVKKEARAVQSRGGFTLFALFLLLFALGASAAGFAATQAGR